MNVPLVQLGRAKTSRLICGCNQIVGNSHQTKDLDREMVDYFTAANVKALFAECERCGINTFQGVACTYFQRLLHEYWNEGGTIQWMAQTDSREGNLIANVRVAARYNAVAIYHHGTRTGNLWRTGRIDELRELIDEIKSHGIAAGVGAHKPEIIEHIEAAGWPVDFYMASFYNVYKAETGWRESYLVSGVRRPEVYDKADRDRMVRAIQATEKPCLAFKVLGSGREAGTSESLREALAFALDNIKPTDALVVGMFPKHSNQVAEDAGIVADLCAP